MIPEDNRFESDPDDALPEDPGLPQGWSVEAPDGEDPATVERLTELLRAHERAGRGWAGSGEDDVLVEVSEHGLAMRENVVVRDTDGRIRAWGSVHDRAEGRMLFVHVVDREIDARAAERCSDVLFEWAEAQARAVGAARGLDGAADRHRSLRRRRAPARLAGRRRLRARTHVVADEPLGGGRRGRPGARPGPLGAQGRRVPPRRARGRPRLGRHARRRRPARGPRGAGGRLHRPLQLRGGDLPGVHPPPARGPRPPLGPLVAGRDHRRRRRRAGRRARRHGERVRQRARRLLRVLPRRPGVRARPRRRHRPAAHDHRRRRVARPRPRRARGRRRLTRPAPTASTPSMGWGTKYVTESWHRDVPVEREGERTA